MAETTSVPLNVAIEVHGKRLDAVTVRAPTAREYFTIGEPFAYARSKEGLLITGENDDAIRQYVEKCLVEDPIAVLAQLGLADGMALKEAVLDFFSKARAQK